MTILMDVQTIYEENLNSDFGKLAKHYLTHERGISEDLLKEFGVGYCTGNVRTKLANHKGELIQQGILNAHYNERNYQRIMFPIHDEQGNLIGFNGRTLKEKQPNEIAYTKYLLSPESLAFSKTKTLYNLHRAKEEIQKQGFVYLVEGVLDCLSYYAVGKKNVVSTLGTALTKEHIELLSQYTTSIVIGNDNDFPGFKASIESARKIATFHREHLNEEALKTYRATDSIRFVKLPKGHDPNQSYLHNREQFKTCLETILPYTPYCKQMCEENPEYHQVFDSIQRSEELNQDMKQSQHEAFRFKQQFKQHLDIVSVIQEIGNVHLQKKGRNFVGCCPFHQEKTPSLTVSPDKQIFKCFGCGEGGDVIKYVAKSKQLSYHQSIHYLKEQYLEHTKSIPKSKSKESEYEYGK